jgi:hypothetical protein
MRGLLSRIRPQVFLAMVILGGLAGFLVSEGALEGGVGLGGAISLLAKEVIQSESAGS